MNIGSILLLVLAALGLVSGALFASRGEVLGTVIFLLSVPLFVHMAIAENNHEAL